MRLSTPNPQHRISCGFSGGLGRGVGLAQSVLEPLGLFPLLSKSLLRLPCLSFGFGRLHIGTGERFVAEHDVESMSTRELDKALKEREEALEAMAAAEDAARGLRRTPPPPVGPAAAMFGFPASPFLRSGQGAEPPP